MVGLKWGQRGKHIKARDTVTRHICRRVKGVPAAFRHSYAINLRGCEQTCTAG